MLEIFQSSRFKRDLKKARKQGKDFSEIKLVIDTLAKGNSLPKKYKDHNLSGDYASYRECHIRPDWLLIYKVVDNELQLVRTGSHAELFE